ncbi:hypothetical protein [Sediminivirga luteola]|uniref:Uncharacterized protein n=1 Tax=Sediminivirga luteola TaxID=1774748 RepID=A0A8J2U072_9MICO|nr:hypothetical protein [Sediminivirga luteola]GGA23251.1 hypothetical protein GCM10011333_27920 [Sediminivirga luteola]
MNATSTPSAGPGTRARSGSASRGIVLIVVGAVLFLAGPVAGVLGGSAAMVPSSLSVAGSTVEVGTTTTLTLQEGERIVLLAPRGQLADVSASDCAVTAPDGTAQAGPDREPASTLNTMVSGETYESFAGFTASAAGAYELSCRTDVPVVAMPPVSALGMLSPMLWGAAAGLLGSVSGLVLLVLGLVRMARR